MKRILLVEDDPFLGDIYITKLEKAGFFVEIAKDVREGLKKLKEKSFHLILLDIVLPEIQGWELLKKIKKDKKFEKIPVVILSNLGQKEEIEKGLKLGAKKYLIKAHYTPSQILEEIKKVLK